ncbi:MAG: hypothetical protein JW774_05525 [Candidatus Aureabacteria bacterium]|nr:hypothetical protein [Candidatus Auribacterota bacterium]
MEYANAGSKNSKRRVSILDFFFFFFPDQGKTDFYSFIAYPNNGHLYGSHQTVSLIQTLSPSTRMDDKKEQTALLLSAFQNGFSDFIAGRIQQIRQALHAETPLYTAFEDSDLVSELKKTTATPFDGKNPEKKQFQQVQDAFTIESWFHTAKKTGDIGVLQDQLNTKSEEKPGLNPPSVQNLSALYQTLNPSQITALRLAFMFRQASSILKIGKNPAKSVELIEPGLNVLVGQDVISELEKDLALALISQHEEFNTIQFGEPVPPKIKTYLREKSLSDQDYYPAAAFMYVVDNGSFKAGILKTSMIDNAVWLSDSQHIASLYDHWEKVRWIYGFQGEGRTPIALSKLSHVDQLQLPEFIRPELDSAGPDEYALTFEEMLRTQMSYVGWAYHFFRRLRGETLLKFCYLNRKILEYTQKKGRPFHILQFLVVEKDFNHIQDNAQLAESVFSDLSCSDIADFFRREFSDDNQLFEAIHDRFHLSFALSGDILLLDWNKTYTSLERSELDRFPVTQKILESRA